MLESLIINLFFAWPWLGGAIAGLMAGLFAKFKWQSILLVTPLCCYTGSQFFFVMIKTRPLVSLPTDYHQYKAVFPLSYPVIGGILTVVAILAATKLARHALQYASR